MMKNNSNNYRTLFHSFRDAFRGVWQCIKTERNMRIHLCTCCYVLFFAFYMNFTRLELAVLSLTMGSVLAAEILNTSVEKLCDFVHSDYERHIGVIKDLAAGAVVVSAIAAAGVGAALFFRAELIDALLSLFTQPLFALLFVISIALAMVFVILGPAGIAARFKNKK